MKQICQKKIALVKFRVGHIDVCNVSCYTLLQVRSILFQIQKTLLDGTDNSQ